MSMNTSQIAETGGKAGHTPGPWNIDEFTRDVEANGYQIASIPRHTLPDKECDANAHLIAAAPALLEALREAMDEGYDCGHHRNCKAICGPGEETWVEEDKCNCYMRKARAALAQAEGRAQ